MLNVIFWSCVICVKWNVLLFHLGSVIPHPKVKKYNSSGGGKVKMYIRIYRGYILFYFPSAIQDVKMGACVREKGDDECKREISC